MTIGRRYIYPTTLQTRTARPVLLNLWSNIKIQRHIPVFKSSWFNTDGIEHGDISLQDILPETASNRIHPLAECLGRRDCICNSQCRLKVIRMEFTD